MFEIVLMRSPDGVPVKLEPQTNAAHNPKSAVGQRKIGPYPHQAFGDAVLDNLLTGFRHTAASNRTNTT